MSYAIIASANGRMPTRTRRCRAPSRGCRLPTPSPGPMANPQTPHVRHRRAGIREADYDAFIIASPLAEWHAPT